MFCFVDCRTTDEEIYNLSKISDNLVIIKVPNNKITYEAISSHPDIQMNLLFSKELDKPSIIVHKNMEQTFIDQLNKNNISYTFSKNPIGAKYPGDIILNAFINDKYFIHNTKYSDETLLSYQTNKEIISVSQGYTKCSILPIRDNILITSDIGIYKTLSDYNFKMLYVKPGDIVLPSLNYGFIGGCGGMVSNDKMAFFGNLDNYAFGDQVKQFLYDSDVEPVYLSQGKLVDRGSLFILH